MRIRFTTAGGPSGGSGATQTTDPATLAARQVSFLTQFLTLTTGQQTQATTIFTAAITANQALDTQETTARTASDYRDQGEQHRRHHHAGHSVGQIEAQEISKRPRPTPRSTPCSPPTRRPSWMTVNSDGFLRTRFRHPRSWRPLGRVELSRRRLRII